MGTRILCFCPIQLCKSQGSRRFEVLWDVFSESRFLLQGSRLASGRNMSIILIVDKIRSLSIEFDTNQSTNIGNR